MNHWSIKKMPAYLKLEQYIPYFANKTSYDAFVKDLTQAVEEASERENARPIHITNDGKIVVGVVPAKECMASSVSRELSKDPSALEEITDRIKNDKIVD